MSELEKELLRQIRAAGLPEPLLGHRFAQGLGRRWAFDLAWTWPGWYAVEVDGGNWVAGAHGKGQQSENDMVKAAVAQLLGWEVYRVNNHMIEDGRALLIIQSVLEGTHDQAGVRLARERCRRCDLSKTRRRQKQRAKEKANG